MKEIPIIIPAYEPDERLIKLLKEFREKNVRDVILVDDGSSVEYKEIFQQAKQILREIDGILLIHECNQGKGRALKTAFSYILDNCPEAIGTVTADSDGQHTIECISSVSDELLKNPNKLILGVRNFEEENIPWKSEFGNKITMKVLGYVSGIHVSDTQTGLRGIPRGFMKELINVAGERFEFETRMLLESVGKYSIKEVPIKTIYDSKENHQTHFRPIKDSLKIYKILGAKFFKYIFTSLSASVLDILIFTICCYLLKEGNSASQIVIATITARFFSATYNCAMNYKVVFNSNEKVLRAVLKYIFLAVIQMSLSAIFVIGGVKILAPISEVIVKIVVDTVLFFISFYIQRKYVFKKQ